MAIAGVKMHQGRLRSCITWAERALDNAVVAGNRRAEAHAYYLLDVALTDLGSPDAARYRGRSLPIFEEIADLAGVARTLGNLSVDARYEGRWDEALELAERSSEAQHRCGDVTGLAMSQYNAAEVLQDQGKLGTRRGDAGQRSPNMACRRIHARCGGRERRPRPCCRTNPRRCPSAGADRSIRGCAHQSRSRLVGRGDQRPPRGGRSVRRQVGGRAPSATDGSEGTTGEGQDAALTSKLLRFRGVAPCSPRRSTRTALADAVEGSSRRLRLRCRLRTCARAAGTFEVCRVETRLTLTGSAAMTTLESLGVVAPHVLIPDY